MHGAHIVNRSKGTLVTSAPNGTFKLPASSGDTVEITYIGYQPFLTQVTDEMLGSNMLIAMTPEEVLLEDVVITPFPDYWDFKQSIIELEIPDSTLKISVPNVGAYAFYDPRSARLPEDIPTPAIAIPFDLSNFTKQAKEKKKLQQKLELAQKWKKANEKFNRDWVGQITELEGDELTSFLAFCNFSVDYILETHLIELKHEVLALLSEFEPTKREENERGINYPPGA